MSLVQPWKDKCALGPEDLKLWISNQFDCLDEYMLACTYRRKRCGEDCIFAPYFPAEKAEDFENVNWLFGVQNAINILTSVTEDERSKTAETMMIEAKIRRENPVHGPFAIEKKLRDEIETLRKEMEVVQEQLDLNKSKGKDKVV